MLHIELERAELQKQAAVNELKTSELKKQLMQDQIDDYYRSSLDDFSRIIKLSTIDSTELQNYSQQNFQLYDSLFLFNFSFNIFILILSIIYYLYYYCLVLIFFSFNIFLLIC